MEGRIHIYHPKRNLTLFEHVSLSASPTDNYATGISENVLLFVGGMFDNYGTPGYVATLGALFPRHEDQKWSVIHIQLTSAGRFFGVVDINRDIDEIATGINFIREKLRADQPTNIVLMGHSTGCQDTLHYLHSPNPTPTASSDDSSSSTYKPGLRPCVQGAILQAPVSDREALLHEINTKSEARTKYDQLMKLIDQTPEDEYQTTILPMHLTKPLFGPVPASIRRWLDLFSPGSPKHPSIEDLLSFDLPPHIINHTFGNVGANGVLVPSSQKDKQEISTSSTSISPQKAMLILISDADECYTPEISKKKSEFLPKWAAALKSASDPENRVELHPESKCIPNAKHDVSGDNPARKKARLVDLRGAVLRYIDDVVGGVDQIAWDIFKRDENDIESGGGDAADEKSRL